MNRIIKRQIPNSVNKRLNTISSDKKQFDGAKKEYQEALNKSGYRKKLETFRKMSSFEVKSANISFELCKIILKKTQSYKILEKQAN